MGTCVYVCVCVCVCVCARVHALMHACMCVCMHVYACVCVRIYIYALRIVSTDKILCHINTLIIIITSGTEPLLMCTLCVRCSLNCG